MQSIFMNKGKMPDESDLKKALNKTFPYWKTIEEFTMKAESFAVKRMRRLWHVMYQMKLKMN